MVGAQAPPSNLLKTLSFFSVNPALGREGIPTLT